MEKILSLISIIIIIVYALYNANVRYSKKSKNNTNTNYAKHIEEHNASHYEEELQKVHTVGYLKQYIVDVINHGSSQLAFKSDEVMEGGIALEEDAPKIACYVLKLSGKKCKIPYSKDAAMYYSSNCAGCHGDDGKGLHGAYPDLTVSTLLGIKKRDEFLSRVLK